MSDMFEGDEGAPRDVEPTASDDHPHPPAPTIWPVTVAFGITMLSLGMLTNLAFILFGVVVVALGAYGWAGDLRRE